MRKQTSIISQKTVYSSKFFKVNEFTLEKNGEIFVKSFIERDPFIIILPLTEDNQLYLVSQYREALGKVCLEVVAGFIEKNEFAEEAAKRELKEETGFSAKQWRQLGLINISANMVAQANIFLAQDLEKGESKHDPEEEITGVVKIPLEKAVEKVLLGEIDIVSSVSAILLLDNLQRHGRI